MSVPAKKQSKARTKKRKAGHGGVAKTLMVKCKSCGASIPPHVACPECGMYKGRSTRSEDVAATVKKAKK